MVAITRPIKKGSYLRRRLFNQLDQLREKPMVWISAPAGSGKTTLVSSYSETRNLPCLWYQCNKDDSDPATFFYYMGLAASKAAPGNRKPLPLFTPEFQQGIATFTRNYFHALYRRLKKPSLVVLDNYQDVGDDAVLADILDTATAQLPEGINIMVISRHDPPDSLIRLQANSVMDVLRWQDIRLTEDEVQEIVHQRTKTPCSEVFLQNLYQMTDGWAAGVVLVVTAQKNPGESNRIGKQSYDEIMAYFGQEVFNRFDPAMQNFFIRTSFFPKMTVPMAMEITGEPSADDILRQMNKNNYFISRHGYTDPLYEYHPLYRNFLQAQAKKLLSPDQLLDLRIKSANLLEQNSQTGEAISLLREAAQWEAMALIIIVHARDMLTEGRHHLLQEWVETLPPEVIQDNPWLLFFRAMSMLPFDPPAAQAIFGEAFDKFQKQQDSIGAILSACGLINAIILGYDDFTPLDHWRTVLNELAQNTGSFPDKEVEALVTGSLVMASSWREVYSPETEVWAQRAFSIPETSANINIKVQAVYLTYWHRLVYRGIPEALPLLQDLRRMAGARSAQPFVTTITQLAEVQYHLCAGLHDQLMTAAIKGLDIAERTGMHIVDVWYYIFIIMSHIDRMDLTGAELWLDKIQSTVNTWPNWAKTTYQTMMTYIEIFRKDFTRALYEGELGIKLAIKSGNPFSIAMSNLSLANLYHISGNHQKAIEHLEQGRSYASQRQAEVTMALVLMYDAYFAIDDGDEVRGISALAQSLALARKCEIAIHMTYDPMMALRMCEKALEYGIEVEYVRQIIRRRHLIPQKSPVHLENWPWVVKIYTLGRFSIVINDKPLPPQRKAKQGPLKLLKAVIALGGRDVPSGELADLLWPDAEGDAAYHALETTVQRLRVLLGYPEALTMTDGKLTLDHRYCWVDVWAFERLLGQADACNPDESLLKKTFIEKAIGLYKNSFFAGENKDSWLIASAQRLMERYFTHARWLMNYLEQTGRLEELARYCEQFIKIDACREDVYYRLMVCHHRLGRKSEALLVYNRCRQALLSLLGISPSADLQAFHQQILTEIQASSKQTF